MSLNLDKTGWRRVTLGEVAAASKEKVDPSSDDVKRYVAGEHMVTDDLRISRWGDVDAIDLGPAFHRRFRPGQVLYGSRRTYLRKVAVAEFDGVCANTTFVVESKDEGQLLQTFLPYMMTSEPFHAFAIAESKGSVNPYVNWSDIARYEFDLPPIDDQQRIADLLWAAERHRRSSEEVSRSIRAAVDRFLTDWWDTAQLKPIGSIGKCLTGGTPPKSNPLFWDSKDVPFFTPTEIVGDTVAVPRQWVSSEGAKRGRQLPAGSVLVACIGGDMGKATVLDRPAVTNQQITAVTGLKDAEAYLLQALLVHRRGRQATASRETTTIVRKLNKSDLMKVQLPWDSGRHGAASVVGNGRDALAALAVEVRTLVGLRSSLLTEIFGGN